MTSVCEGYSVYNLCVWGLQCLWPVCKGYSVHDFCERGLQCSWLFCARVTVFMTYVWEYYNVTCCIRWTRVSRRWCGCRACTSQSPTSPPSSRPPAGRTAGPSTSPPSTPPSPSGPAQRRSQRRLTKVCTPHTGPHTVVVWAHHIKLRLVVWSIGFSCLSSVINHWWFVLFPLWFVLIIHYLFYKTVYSSFNLNNYCCCPHTYFLLWSSPMNKTCTVSLACHL